MSDGNLGKTLEKIMGRIKKEPSETEEREAEQMGGSTVSTVPDKVYLKALSLHSLSEIDGIKSEIKSGNIVIMKVSALAEKSMDDVKRAVGELSEFIGMIGGDIARLGEERVVVTPSFVRIWRKTEETASRAVEPTEA